MALESYNQPDAPFISASLPFILTVIDALEEPVFVKDDQHRFVLINDVLCRLIGKSREELLGHGDYDFFPKAQADVFREQDRLVLETGETRINEEQITWHGDVHTIQTTKQRYTDPASGQRYIVGTIKDLSGSQDSVAALISGWGAMQRVLEATGTVLFEQDLDLRYDRFLSAHPIFPKERFLGKTDAEAFAGDESHPLIKSKRKVIETGEPLQFEATVTAEGNPYTFEVFVAPRHGSDGSISGVLCSAIDITKEKHVLRSLASSRQRFRTVFDEAPIPMLLATRSGEIVEVNNAMSEFVEYPTDQLTRLDRKPFSTEQAPFLDQAYLANPVVEEDVAHSCERRLQTASGREVWADVTIKTFADTASDDVLLVAMLRDITAQRDLLERLRRRETILSAVAFIAERFLQNPDFEASIAPSLDRLGKATNVSRVYVFENASTADGRISTSQRFEWVNDGIRPEIDNPDLQGLVLEGPFEDLSRPLSRGETVYGQIDELNPRLQAMYQAQDIRSIVLVPLFVGKKWWGIMGFDECRLERQWSDLEIDGLKAAAGIIGAAIGRSGALRALSASENRWRSLVDNDPDGILELDDQGRILFINRVYPGYSKADVLGHNVLEFIHPDHREVYRRGLKHAEETGEVVRFTIAAVDARGKESWWSCRIVRIQSDDNRMTFLALGTDVTELKRHEQELFESREQYRMLVESQTELIVKVDLAGNFLFASPTYCTTFGLDREKIIGQNSFWPLVHPDDLEATRLAMADVVNPPYEITIEQRAQTPDGWRWFEWIDRALLDNEGNVSAIMGVGRDITDRKRFEDALLESESRFRELAETTNAAIFIYQGADTVYANPAAQQITGYSLDEFRAMSFWPMIHPDHRPLVEERAKKRQEGNDSIPNRYELKIITKLGDVKWLDFTGSTVMHDGRPAVLGTAFDVTARKNAEEAQARLTAELKQQRESLQREKYALERVVSQIEVSKREYKEQVGDAVKRTLSPMFDKLRSAAPPDLKIEIDAASDRLDSVLGEGTSVQKIKLSQLTGREWEICRLIQAGQSSKEIAESLNLSVMTIHKHRERIRKKLGLTSKNIDLSTFLNLYRDT